MPPHFSKKKDMGQKKPKFTVSPKKILKGEKENRNQRGGSVVNPAERGKHW